jgi:murein DD-endopeptidase MepM/ murein hydrolase activator NlpD
MAATKFKYNPRTLRYERIGTSIVNIALQGFGYLIFGSLFFVALVMLQNYVIVTPVERSLRSENEALDRHKIILTASLQESDARIRELKMEDQKLYERLFETKLVRHVESNTYKKEEILTAEPGLFAQWESAIKENAKAIFQKATQRNGVWGKSIHVHKSDVKTVSGLPTLSPIENLDPDKLVSGFGKRINPFHKGLYHHDGVDIAMPIGSDVLATASGTIVLANKSTLVAGFGNQIEIDHDDGITTRYAHLGELKVHHGQRVSKGQVIATVGTSGGSIAPHLHYEVIRNGKNVNPVHYMVERFTSTFYNALVVASEKENQSLD